MRKSNLRIGLTISAGLEVHEACLNLKSRGISCMPNVAILESHLSVRKSVVFEQVCSDYSVVDNMVHMGTVNNSNNT